MPQGTKRRDVIAAAFKSVGLCALSAAELDAQAQVNRNAPVSPKDNLKIHTNVGLGATLWAC